jgi:flagellar biosynthesis activator protein FlaF
MQSAAQAYGAIARKIASPRELEADLLLQAAARMQAVYDCWDDKRGDLDGALLQNRKLWSIFLTSVTETDHPMPPAIRQNVANLGVFVMNRTVSLLADPQRAELVTLININRELEAGLLGR